ncbi:hypothetical protein GCM10009603_08490 [Nocardiopsis exhalans]
MYNEVSVRASLPEFQAEKADPPKTATAVTAKIPHTTPKRSIVWCESSLNLLPKAMIVSLNAMSVYTPAPLSLSMRE